ncbi:hypothetical protein D9611_010019 [Ephemerocybe angulata]|uniref:Ribonucleases P/MRP subunit Pop8-like domain-containing protein n=1 Tax=Ephemerocybe angulata TaxID=980116 RepID=A0A8H5FFV5_9AGAR|nr:hypothetical protein D9611_010019 [Tulosesus angulatus]
MAPQAHPIASDKHYIHLSVAPPTRDALTVRKALADALEATFGIVGGAVRLDVLAVLEEGRGCVVRVDEGDARKVLAAVVGAGGGLRMGVVRESGVLTALGVGGADL